jgi:hypothetical protein
LCSFIKSQTLFFCFPKPSSLLAHFRLQPNSQKSAGAPPSLCTGSLALQPSTVAWPSRPSSAASPPISLPRRNC